MNLLLLFRNSTAIHFRMLPICRIASRETVSRTLKEASVHHRIPAKQQTLNKQTEHSA